MTREIRAVDATTRDQAYRILATAFAEDPVLRWLAPDSARDHAIFRGLDLALHGPGARSHLLYDDGVAVGAAYWDPPGHRPSPIRKLRSAPVLARALRGGIGRGLALDRAVRPHHPAEPHWYLATIGANLTGRGVGSDLLRHQLDQIEGPAYLESSNIRNNPLYERFGFEVTAEIRPAKDSPTLWAMYRK